MLLNRQPTLHRPSIQAHQVSDTAVRLPDPVNWVSDAAVRPMDSEHRVSDTAVRPTDPGTRGK